MLRQSSLRTFRSLESLELTRVPAAFWKNPEKYWLNLAKIQQNSGKICEILEKIIVPLIPKDMFRLVCLVKLVFFAREGVAF